MSQITFFPTQGKSDGVNDHFLLATFLTTVDLLRRYLSILAALEASQTLFVRSFIQLIDLAVEDDSKHGIVQGDDDAGAWSQTSNS